MRLRSSPTTRVFSLRSSTSTYIRLRCASYISFRDRARYFCPDNRRPISPRTNSRRISHCPPLDAAARTRTRHSLRSDLSLSLLAGVICLGLIYGLLRPSKAESIDTVEDPAASTADMSTEVLPGRPGNLTPEQEEKLRQLWGLIFQICAVRPDEDATGAADSASVAPSKADSVKGDKPRKKGLSVFSRKGKRDGESDSTSPGTPNGGLTPKEGDDDKYGQTKQFYETLANQSPESIRATIWSMVKHDHPDALVLRFLRARKWDVENALHMLVSTMHWRARDVHVDDDIMMNGEGAAVESENSKDAAAAKLAHDFLAQIRMGKSFLHGVDRKGRPICVVRVRLHKQGEQTEESLERYTVYIIETARMVLQPPVDTATIVFDMTGFSMANMDYTPVKFMVKCFEANYPESLGTVLVHKAPWIFQGIWRIIKGWLDPVVAAKVHFTNSKKDMEEFIPPNQILKELDGEEDWDYKYAEPVPGENDKMKDTETRDRLLANRAQLFRDYEEATMEWIQTPAGEQGQEIKARRDAIAADLREDYWIVDPYIRARSLYDRTGVLQPGGKLDYYPKPAEVAVKANGTSTTTTAAVEPSPDDID